MLLVMSLDIHFREILCLIFAHSSLISRQLLVHLQLLGVFIQTVVQSYIYSMFWPQELSSGITIK